MSQLNIQNINHESNGPLLHKKCTFTFTFQSESHFTFYHQEHVSQWWEHINLATTWRAKLKGAHEHSRRLKFAKTHMQSIPSMDMIVIEDYYHMTTMDENVNWMNLAHLLSMFSLNMRPFFYICLSFNVLNSLF